MANQLLNQPDDNSDNPYGSGYLNPEIFDGVNQIADELNSITKSINTHIRRGIKSVDSRLMDVENTLPQQPLVADTNVVAPPCDADWGHYIDGCVKGCFYKPIDPIGQQTMLDLIRMCLRGDGFELYLEQEGPFPNSWILGVCGGDETKVFNSFLKCIARTGLSPCVCLAFEGGGGPNECPPGFHWDEATQRCVSDITNTTTDGKCCPVTVNTQCPPPIIKNDITVLPAEVKCPDVVIKEIINKEQITNNITCPPPVVNITNVIDVTGGTTPEDECKKQCDDIEDDDEKQKCLKNLCKKPKNWLEYAISEEGKKDLQRYALDEQFPMEIFGGGTIVGAWINAANIFKQGVTGPPGIYIQ